MAEVDFDRNVTSLYDAIVKSDWDKASHACRHSPIEAKTWVVRRDTERRKGAGGDGDILWRFLPLHSACARRPPLKFVIDLLNAYPDAARAKDESGMYPIHYACGNRASKSVIKELVECFPRALQEADPKGMLPLHYIAQWGPSEDGVVELLMDVCAEGALALNSESMSPLDLCKEANYDDWGKVLAVMEDKVTDLRRIGKRMELGVPREIEARLEDPPPTAEVPRVGVTKRKKHVRSHLCPDQECPRVAVLERLKSMTRIHLILLENSLGVTGRCDPRPHQEDHPCVFIQNGHQLAPNTTNVTRYLLQERVTMKDVRLLDPCNPSGLIFLLFLSRVSHIQTLHVEADSKLQVLLPVLVIVI